MWTPPQRIRHGLADGGWPTAEQAARSRLFSPARVGSVQLAQRTWVPAMVPWRATDDGRVSEDVIAWYRRFADGRPGAIVVEATGIRDIPSGPLLRIGDDRFVDGLRRVVAAVREASAGETRLFIQLIDFLTVRRRPERQRFFERYLEVTDRHRDALVAITGAARWRDATEGELRAGIAALSDDQLDDALAPRELEALRYGYRERVWDMHVPHVRALPEVLPGLFADAAERAVAAGFDGVELHYAHAYTMASFLSALNTRDDGYGGARERRVRLPREVLSAVRARVGDSPVVGVRLLGDEVIAGGSGIDDAAYFSVELARAGADFVSVSKGGKFEDAAQPKVGWAVYPYTGPSGYECMPTVRSDERGPFGRNVELAAAIKRALGVAGVGVPVVAAGGIGTFALAEAILARGEADIIAAARASLADPDWWLKMRLGRGAEVRRCEYTNYCEALDQRHRQVTCKLWDREGVGGGGVALASDGRRRLVAPRWRRG